MDDLTDEPADDSRYCEPHTDLIRSVARLRAKETSYAEIARRLNIPLPQANEAGRQAGFRGYLKDLDMAFVSAVAELRNAGMPYAAMAVGLGVSETKVREAGKKAGFIGLLKKSPKARETWNVLPPS